jgi:hypothetical protein
MFFMAGNYLSDGTGILISLPTIKLFGLILGLARLTWSSVTGALLVIGLPILFDLSHFVVNLANIRTRDRADLRILKAVLNVDNLPAQRRHFPKKLLDAPLLRLVGQLQTLQGGRGPALKLFGFALGGDGGGVLGKGADRNSPNQGKHQITFHGVRIWMAAPRARILRGR